MPTAPTCQMFVLHAFSATSVLHTFCNSITADASVTAGVSSSDADNAASAMLASAPCRRSGLRPWHRFPSEYPPQLESIRVRAAAQPQPGHLALYEAGQSVEVSYHPKRLLFAYSFWLTKSAKVTANLEQWHQHGEPCSGRVAKFMTLVMAPGFVLVVPTSVRTSQAH